MEKKFNCEFCFDTNEFDERLLTPQYVHRILISKGLENRGVRITVTEKTE